MYQGHKERLNQSISNRLKQEGSWDRYTHLGFKPLVWAEETRESEKDKKRERGMSKTGTSQFRALEAGQKHFKSLNPHLTSLELSALTLKCSS